MKRFAGKTVLFLCMFFVLLAVLDVLSLVPPFRGWFAYLTESSDYYAGSQDEVALYFDRIRSEGDYTKLIVGDSVCNQMFNNLQEINDDYCIVGNNRALTLAGQYLLVQEFLKLHEGVTDVYVIVGLDALQADIDVTYGYAYVMIPFSRERLLQNLDEKTLSEVRDRFGTLFVQRPVVMMIANSSVNRKLYMSYIKEHEQQVPFTGEILLSDLAAEYLVRIRDLCEAYGTTLHLLPDPLAEVDYRHDQARGLQKDFADRGLDELFPDYFDEIVYYPEEQFHDGIHFGGEYYAQEELNQKIRDMYLSQGYLDGLVLEE